MHRFIIAGALGVLAAPAFAQEPTTLDHVTTKGVVLTAMGMDIPITYNADGSFSLEAMGQAVTGKWRVDGTKLCTTSDMQPEERCTEYPTGKGPGDEFEVQGAMGSAKVKINP